MKKILIFLPILLILTSCAVRYTDEGADVNAPVSVEDNREESTSSAVFSTVPPTSVTEVMTTLIEKTAALSEVITAVRPDDHNGLSTEKREHSYGVAKDGKPHHISVSAQKYFESTGYKAICYDTKSTENVLYLTFDCGWENGCTSKVLDTLKEKNVPSAFFCTLDHIKSTPDLIRRMIDEGHIVGNHSMKHPDFAKISRQRMKDEILGCNEYLNENFGYTSNFFRFPEGSYNESALELVDSLGMTSVFWSCAYADWDVNNTKGAQYAFDTVTSRLHPGAIILLHSVSPDNAEALGDIIDWARNNGYVFKSLNDLNM